MTDSPASVLFDEFGNPVNVVQDIDGYYSIQTYSPTADGYLSNINIGVQTINSLVPSVYDYISLSYDGSNNLSAVSYYQGGSLGTLISTLTLTYDVNNNLISVARTP